MSFLTDIVRLSLAVSLCAQLAGAARAQDPAPARPPAAQDEVIKVNTNLLQTDVVVTDRQGRVVDDLKAEQFELQVDGQTRPISFFERVVSGSAEEETQRKAARGTPATASGNSVSDAKTETPARTVIFFLDDFHLSLESLAHTRRMLLHFIDNEMQDRDQVLIASTSAQTGFLEQLTDNKAMLRAAASKLTIRERKVRDIQRPPMTVYQALALDRDDPDAVTYFTGQTPQQRSSGPDLFEAVRSRAREILRQAAYINDSTLYRLQHILRSAARMPGRKLAFFVSDGFFLDPRQSTIIEKLRETADRAVRAGVVFYSLDARGLDTRGPDPSEGQAADTTGLLARLSAGELAASQDPLNSLAVDTGGRALLNSNSLTGLVGKALRETSVYYLLAWQAGEDETKERKAHRVTVRVRGRSDLNVMVGRRAFDAGWKESPIAEAADKKSEDADRKPADNKTADNKTKTNEPAPTGLRKLIEEPFAQRALPVFLSLGYTNTAEQGTVLTASVQLEMSATDPSGGGGDAPAKAELLAVVIDANGKVVSNIEGMLNVAPAAKQPKRMALSSHEFRVAPGLYQVRVGARDTRSGVAGSAVEWIEVPDLARQEFALSSPTVGELKEGEDGATLNASRRFSADSMLRLLVFVYNAARSGEETPDVSLRVEVVRDNKTAMTTEMSVRTQDESDLTRLPYAAELPLRDLAPGRYLLRLTATDHVANKTATQSLSFDIE